MKIIIKNKNGLGIGRIAGIITSNRINVGLDMKINYQRKPNFFIKLQKLLLKYFELEVQSSGKKITSKLIVKKLKGG